MHPMELLLQQLKQSAKLGSSANDQALQSVLNQAVEAWKRGEASEFMLQLLHLPDRPADRKSFLARLEPSLN